MMYISSFMSFHLNVSMFGKLVGFISTNSCVVINVEKNILIILQTLWI